MVGVGGPGRRRGHPPPPGRRRVPGLERRTRRTLAELAGTLHWQGDAASTYAQVVPAVNDALKALRRQVAVDPASVPNAAAHLDTLERLRLESRALLEHTSSPDFEQGAIDDDMMLTGAVDEWRFIVQTLADRLDQAAHAAGTPVSTAADVDAGTPPAPCSPTTRLDPTWW